MKTLSTAFIATCLALAAGGLAAQDAMKKSDTMTMAQCKTHMDAAKKDGAQGDAAMMKKSEMCNEMMKKDGKTGDAMKK